MLHFFLDNTGDTDGTKFVSSQPKKWSCKVIMPEVTAMLPMPIVALTGELPLADRCENLSVQARLRSALRGKAKFVGLSMDGHAPLIFKRSRLVAALKGVTVLSAYVICGLEAVNGGSFTHYAKGTVRLLCVEGTAGMSTRTSFKMCSLTRAEAINGNKAGSSGKVKRGSKVEQAIRKEASGLIGLCDPKTVVKRWYRQNPEDYEFSRYLIEQSYAPNKVHMRELLGKAVSRALHGRIEDFMKNLISIGFDVRDFKKHYVQGDIFRMNEAGKSVLQLLVCQLPTKPRIAVDSDMQGVCRYYPILADIQERKRILENIKALEKLLPNTATVTA